MNVCYFCYRGGVIAKTYHAPLGNRGAHMLQKIDKLFVQIAPGFFSCGCSVVLQKKAVNNIQE